MGATPQPGAGRRVLVTGASSGIGLATGVALAGAGFATSGTVRSEAGAKALADAAARAGVVVAVEELEVTDEAARAALVERVRPWGLVSNAGYVNAGLVEDVPLDAARAQLEAMVVGPTHLAVLAAGHMAEAGGGRVVHVGSVSGRAGLPLMGWYQAAKHALVGVSEALRPELAGRGVEVVLVEPGGFRTAIWPGAAGDLRERSLASGRPEAYERALSLMGRLAPRMGDARRVASVVVEALTADRPRARYHVGYDAWPLELLGTVVPTQVRDVVLRRLLAL